MRCKSGFITFQFLHADTSHIFSNMLSLFFFGPIVESYFGRLRYIVFYLLCGVAGAGCYLLLLAMHILKGADAPLVVLRLASLACLWQARC